MPLRSLACRSLPLILTAALGVEGRSAPLEFNRDVRPILSENCFQCHGQDPAKREAKLRLDERESATRERDGIAPIVPGNPGESELVRRILATDPSDIMPPPESHKTLTPAQVAVLRQWIQEGAPYQKHWAFIPPVRSAPPPVITAGWARGAVDHFILARLEREGLAPSPAAAPEAWLRRVSFDLTGLPPTPAELDAFSRDVAARGEPAYAAAVERLLASPHYGERQALEWLDAARYADTHGFNNDSTRTMWRWRDWVIDAFNANLPYDRFITEQLAGDLLLRPSLEQRIATGFGRNHVINSEGGIIDEEYRVEYVADRVRTLSTAWLGLTMECAKCHDHKFDPVTQRDYYRLFAFFNNVPEHGEDGRVANAVPMIPAPTRAQQAQLAEQTKRLAELDLALKPSAARWRWQPSLREAVDAELTAARAIFQRELALAVAAKEKDLAEAAAKEAAAKEKLANEKTAAPATALVAWQVEAGEGVALLPPDNVSDGANVIGDAWRATPTSPNAAAPKIAAAKLDFAAKEGVTLMGWLRPDADNPRDVPLLSSLNHQGSKADAQYGKGREVRLIDGEIEVRLSERFPAYSILVRTTGADIRAGEWRHVAVTYAGGKRASAVRVFVDGTELALNVAYDDMPGEPPKREFLLGADNATDSATFRGRFDEMRGFPRALSAASVGARFAEEAFPYAMARATAGSASQRELGWLRGAWLAQEISTAAAVRERREVWEQHLALRRSLPTAMVMEELPQPRPAFVLTRGQYDAPAERVEAGVPENLLAPWPKDAPKNRLGLAQWLTQPQHPLTARVVVNRMWAQLFGTGLVKTLEDFGSQSEWPSHPELLDFLAREFVDGGWDVKAMLRTLVLSATYRQSSAITPALLARDPENRLLARGPRVRLPAELIRDQALAVAGLLVPKIGGPSVYPYQPDKLYEGIVVGAEYPGTKWLLSSGEDLHRRSLYTFWKRTMPHPAMTAFDAPDREFCAVRRSRTNTPLQALVLWNEPGLLEAARQLAVTAVREHATDDGARVSGVFRRVVGRGPSAAEVQVLASTLQRLRDEFRAQPQDAIKLLAAIPSADVAGSETATAPAKDTTVAHGNSPAYASSAARAGAAPMSAASDGTASVELAATFGVASMILSLDETVTKN